MKKRVGTPVFAFSRLAIAVAGCFCLGPVHANPVGGVVVPGGSATIVPQGNTLTITNTPGAIINWQGFSIGAGETTRFTQASAASAVLNRVVTNNPSQLLGQLQSNGRVFLINPAGILVGAGAVVDTAGFVASTLNLSNADFLAGRFNFTETLGAGKVENYGTISTPSGGSVYLVGAQVDNHGIINAPNGEVLLAAGKTAQLIDTGTPGVRVELTADTEQALNVGQILAESGRVGMVGAIVRNSGRISASSVTSEGGRVFLKATADAYVEQAGRIDATGTTGGTVEVLGKRVALTDQASIDVSGANGGGTILVGGDYQGKNSEIQNAAISYVGDNVSLKADATVAGNGGKVIVWADDTTRVAGTISAQGGINGGDGGFIETSGKQSVDFSGARIDASAQNGKAGNWLIDPSSLTIDSAGAAALAIALAGTNVEVTENSFSYGQGQSSTSGNITVGSSIMWSSASVLTLNSSQDISIGATISGTNGGLVLKAGSVPGLGNIIQTAGKIKASTLEVVAKGDVTLNEATNLVGTIAANVAGNFAFTNSQTINVGTVGATAGITAGDVTLKTVSGNIWQDSTGVITANSLKVDSVSNVSLQAADNMVDTFAATMTSGSGFLSLKNAKALTLNKTDVMTGNTVDIRTTAGNLTVAGPVTSAGQFRLDAAGGINVNSSINATNGTKLVSHAGGIKGSGIITGNLEVQALGSGDVSLLADNHVSALSAKVTNGSLSFNSVDSFNVGPGTNFSGIIASGDVALSSGDGITQSSAISAASLKTNTVGSVTLDNTANQVNTVTAAVSGPEASFLYKSAAGFTVGTTGVTTNGGNITMNGNGVEAIKIAGNVNAGVGAVLITQSGTGDASSNIETNSGTTISGNSVTLTTTHAASKIAADGNIIGGTGGVSLTAPGKITGVGAVTSAGDLTMTTNGEINQGKLTVAGVTTVNAGTGDISLTNAANSFGGFVNATGGAISIRAAALSFGTFSNGVNKAVDLRTIYGNLSLSGTIDTGTADLTLTSAGTLTTAGDLAGANVGLTGVAGLTLGHNVIAAHDLTLSSGTGMISQTGGSMTVGGALTANAATGIYLSQSGNSAASVSLVNTVSNDVAYTGTGASSSVTISGSNSGGGAFSVSTDKNINLGLISNPGGSVSLTSTDRAILDGNGSSNNISAATAILSAKQGIGKNEAIEMTVSTVSAINSDNGNIRLDNTGPLTTGIISTGTGSVWIATHSPLTIGNDGVSASHDIILTAGNSLGGTGDDLTINGPLSAGHDIVLTAGNAITEIGMLTGHVTRYPNQNQAAPTPPPTTTTPTTPTTPATTATPTLAVAALAAVAEPLQAVQGQTATAMDTIQSTAQPSSSLASSSPVALPPPPVVGSGGISQQTPLQTLPGGVVGGEAPDTFGSAPAAPGGGTADSGEPGSSGEGKNDKKSRKPSQCSA